MKLTEEKIDNILDSATDYVYDDLWNEFDIGWVEDYLNDENIEYDDEDANKILEGLKKSQNNEAQENMQKI